MNCQLDGDDLAISVPMSSNGLLAHAAPDVSAGARGWRCDTVKLLLHFEKWQHQIVV